MEWFKIQTLIPNDHWFSKRNLEKTNCSANPTDWSFLNTVFTEKNDGIKLIYDKIVNAFADMCFTNIRTTHPVWQMDHINSFRGLFEAISE